MKLSNKIMLITYADSLGSNLSDLNYVLNKHLQGIIYGLHILPFYPSSADRGFAPTTYKKVNEKYGTWKDIEKLGEKYYLMFDFMINHISKKSECFTDFIEKKENSKYYDMFIKYSEFWKDGNPSKEQIDLIYKRKPRAPYIDVTFADGTADKVWCTFNEEQIDLDVKKQVTLNFIKDNLIYLCNKNASIIRFDAFAYAVKKADTNCFFIEPDIWNLLDWGRDVLAKENCIVLPEIHEHYKIQKNISNHNYYVYDFSLPMLLLHALYSHTNKRLVNWLKICPRKQFTTLDTHDGIGVVDVKDLMSEKEINITKENLYSYGANIKKKYSSSEYNNLDIYQINCTYYSALGNNDDAYLLARAIQFFTPGIPQVYYVGLLAGSNDIKLLEKTKQGRNINRHYYTLNEIENEVEKPVIKKLFNLMKFRNLYKAFNGDITVNENLPKHNLEITWTKDDYQTILKCNLKDYSFFINYLENGEIKRLEL